MNLHLSKYLYKPMDSSNGDLKEEIHIPATLGYRLNRLKQYVHKVPGSRVPWVSRLMMAYPRRNPSSRDSKASCLAAAQTHLHRHLED